MDYTVAIGVAAAGENHIHAVSIEIEAQTLLISDDRQRDLGRWRCFAASGHAARSHSRTDIVVGKD